MKLLTVIDIYFVFGVESSYVSWQFIFAYSPAQHICYWDRLLITCLFVCFITKSFLTYSFLPPTPALSTIFRPLSSSMCSIIPETANVGSSYNRMRGPGIGCWFSDRSNCSHWSLTLTFILTSDNLSLYTILLLLLVLIQLCNPLCWHIDSN